MQGLKTRLKRMISRDERHWNIAMHPSLFDRALAWLVWILIQSEGRQVAHALLTLVRLRHGNTRVPEDKERPRNPKRPTGPFVVMDEKRAGDLLIYVPRHLYGRLLDDLSGGYGYSHLTVDCGEIDMASGKRVMVEAMPNSPVHRSFLDEYGNKRYARVSLARTGINRKAFCKCVKSLMGEMYDYAEVVTWGRVDDPAKQVCTDLAAACLPEAVQRDFAEHRRSGKLNKSAVSVYHPKNKHTKVFISPNGFAEYFGLPRGEDIKKPGQLFTPTGQLRPIPRHDSGANVWLYRLAWGLGILAGLWLGRALLQGLKQSS